MIRLKKIIIGLFIFTCFISLSKKEEGLIIPDTSIRFRVIANSNTTKDQTEKLMIKDKIEKEVYGLIEGANNTDEVRSLIQNNMDTINEIVSSYEVPYKINYGDNYFPAKNYKGVLYKAGNYESLVITLGEGMGDNFWWVLFPPLCLLDNEQNDVSDIEYQFYVKKLFKQF